MRVRSWTACVAVAAMMVGAAAIPAQAATTNFDLPIDGTATNSCTGEELLIEGTAHVKVTDNSTLSGIKSQIEFNLTGLKATALVTGARYVMNQQSSAMQHEEFDALGDAQVTIEESTLMNRQQETTAGILLTDPGDDFLLHSVIHLTVVNGFTKSSTFDLRADCR
jgi:hypothetical protein